VQDSRPPGAGLGTPDLEITFVFVFNLSTYPYDHSSSLSVLQQCVIDCIRVVMSTETELHQQRGAELHVFVILA